MTHHIVPARGAHNMEREAAYRIIQGDQSMLYACRLPDGLIKIGCSRDISQRRKWLRGEMLGFMPGEFSDELAIHHSLADSVARGREYYHPTPAVLSVVNEMRQSLGLTPLAA
jgi:hypothetical protein